MCPEKITLVPRQFSHLSNTPKLLLIYTDVSDCWSRGKYGNQAPPYDFVLDYRLPAHFDRLWRRW
jgi:hypothetical protein